MSQEIKIHICSGCLKRNSSTEQEPLPLYLDSVFQELKRLRPDINWKVKSSTCYRFCPEGRLAISYWDPRMEREHLTMTRSAAFEDVIKEALACIPKETP